MAPTSRRGCSPNRVRESLARLTINRRLQLHSDRVSKPTSSSSAAHRRHLAELRWLKSRTKPLDLNPNELDCAKAIYNKLLTIPGIAIRSPRLFCCGDDKYELVNPKFTIMKLHGPNVEPEIRIWRELTVEDIYSLLDKLLGDIHTLYDAHIAYTPDITTPSVVQKSGSGALRPFIETFDFSKHVDDQTIPWEDLKKKTIKIITDQFYVLEQMARLRHSLQPLPSDVDLQPDVVPEIIRWSHPPKPQRHLIIRQVNRYSPKFGIFIVDQIEWFICTRNLRRGPADESVNNQVRDGLATVSHTLGLLDEYFEERQIGRDDLAVRARLLMLYLALLIHLHAKIVLEGDGHGLLKYNKLVADLYTSYEGFQSVVSASHQVEDAIRRLEEKGDYIVSWHLFYRGIASVEARARQRQ